MGFCSNPYSLLPGPSHCLGCSETKTNKHAKPQISNSHSLVFGSAASEHLIYCGIILRATFQSGKLQAAWLIGGIELVVADKSVIPDSQQQPVRLFTQTAYTTASIFECLSQRITVPRVSIGSLIQSVFTIDLLL